MRKFGIPNQCRDQPYEKEPQSQQVGENEIIDLFTTIEKQARAQKQQQMQQQYQKQQIQQQYQQMQNTFDFQNSKQTNELDKFNNTLDRIEQRKMLKQTQGSQQQSKNSTLKSTTMGATQKTFNKSKTDKDYTIFDGKINMILEPEQAEMAKDILENLQDYLKERHEQKKDQLLEKRERLDKMQMEYMKNEEFQKKRELLRMDPYEAQLVKDFLQKMNLNNKQSDEIEKYVSEKLPWKKNHKSTVVKPQKASEQDQNELVNKLKQFKHQKRKDAEKNKAEPKLHKKDFDLVEHQSPNPQIVAKFCNQEFSEKTAFYEQKKRNLPAESSEQFSDELEYLQTYFEMMSPDDYLLKCDFYKKGVKVNRDRQVSKKDLIYYMENDEEFRKLYNIQDTEDINQRLRDMKTIHINYINFKEFVEFLYLNGQTKRLENQQYKLMALDLQAVLNQDKKQQEGDEGYESDPEYKDNNTNLQIAQKGKKQRSNSADRIKGTQGNQTEDEYKVKVTVPEPFEGAEYFAKLYAENKKQRLNDSQNRDIQKSLSFQKKFVPKTIPQAVADHYLWERMQADQEEKRKQRKEDSVANTLAQEKPFSFYRKDPNPIKRRKDQRQEEHEINIHNLMESKFKANRKIAWTSTVNMFQQIKDKEKQWREQRKAARAIIMRKMVSNQQEMFENKQKKIQEQSNKYSFKPSKRKQVPDFEKSQQNFQNQLDAKKQARPPTAPQPFNFQQSHKITSRDYLNQENQIMKKMKEFPKEDRLLKAKQVTEQQPQYMPVSTKKNDDLIKFRWKEREEKLQKQIEKSIAEKKKREKKEQFAQNVWDALRDDTDQRKQDEIDRKKRNKEAEQQQKIEYYEWKNDRINSAAEQPLLLTRDNNMGLKYPYNKIFANYENLIRDGNHQKKLGKMEEWQQEQNTQSVSQKAMEFVESLKQKNDLIKNLKNMPYPWNILMKDGEFNVVGAIREDIDQEHKFQWKPTIDRGYLQKHAPPPIPKKDYEFKVSTKQSYKLD